MATSLSAADGQAQLGQSGQAPSARRQTPASQSIASALAQESRNGVVTISGRATVDSGQLQHNSLDIAVQDSTGGVRVFSKSLRVLVREGDSLVATGTIRRYRGDRELVASAVTIIPGPRRKIEPKNVPIDVTVMSSYPGQLVRVRGRVTRFGPSEGGQWLRLRDAANVTGDTITVWIPANHGAPIDLTRVQPDDSLTVTGIVTSYQDNVDDPVVWQLVPRNAADLVLSATHGGRPGWLLWSVLGSVLAVTAAIAIARLNARRQLRAFRETDARYQQLLALSPEAVLVHAEGRIIFTNPAAAELLGVANEQALVGRSIADFANPDSRAALEGRSVNVEGGRTPRVRGHLVKSSGSLLDVEITSSPCVYNDQPAVVVLARDITAQLRYERDLHAMALVDELTGLHNRRGFTLFAEQELARARRQGRVPMLVFADLDDLKLINDVHGHANGDTAIRLVGTALKSILRETDIVARWSGDEFVALLSDGDLAAAQQIRERLDAAIAVQAPANLPYRVTASVGTSTIDPLLALRDAIDRADAELYTQKKRAHQTGRRSTPAEIDAVSEPE
jgi:diguanylate cyclase (GGDEF)-like protein/PAS domain S-box-containing protein